jgi:hypothetical protein
MQLPLNTCNLSIECIYAEFVCHSPLVDICTYQDKAQRMQPSSKYAMNARDAIMQKLQEYSNQSEKML